MKKDWKKWTLRFFILILIIVLSISAYFYIGFAGNPFVMWSQQRAVLKIYEARYPESFIVTNTNYDYKRNEYEVKLSPKQNPEVEFTTTLDEAKRIDLYGRIRSINYLRAEINEVLGSNYSDFEYTFNVFEDYNSPGVMETDLKKRLSLNWYTVDFSFDVPVIKKDELDDLFTEIHAKISKIIVGPIGKMDLRFGAYDGKDYYHFELSL